MFPYDEIPGDAKIYILKVDGLTKPFTILGVIDAFGMFDDETRFRNKTTFEVATLREDFEAGDETGLSFGQIIAIATHIAITPQNDIYSIIEGDELQVAYLDFVYMIYGQIIAQKFDLDENS